MNSRYEGPHHVTDGRSALVTEERIEDGQEVVDEDHQKRINGQSSHDENESKSE